MMRRLRGSSRFGLSVALLAGCASAPPSPPLCPALQPSAHVEASMPAPTSTSFYADAAARKALLAELVSDIRRYHVFAPQIAKNLGRTFDDDLPSIEKEMNDADSRPKVFSALRHLAFALHDTHAGFSAPVREALVAMPFRFGATFDGKAAHFYVTRVSDPARAPDVRVGDALVSMDGVPAEELLGRNALESSGTNWRTIAGEVARHLAVRDTAVSMVRTEAPVRWVFADEKGKKAVEVSWKPLQDEGWSDFAVEYGKNDCLGRPAVDYGAYSLAAVGHGFCLYTSADPKRRGYPIVRWVSFFYGAGAEDVRPYLRADHDSLKSHLAQVPGLRGLLVDVRDNHGGNNANWFLDLLAPAPYVDHFLRVPLHPELASEKLLEPSGLRGARRDKYLAALASKADFVLPARCSPSGCEWDNRYTPGHRVADVPVALLVGGSCGSACDVFAQIFDENDFGPLVGETTASGYPGVRWRREVRTSDGESLGALTLMFGVDVSGKTKAELEGVPLHLDAPLPRTLENTAQYDRLLAEAGMKALEKWKFPPKAK